MDETPHENEVPCTPGVIYMTGENPDVSCSWVPEGGSGARGAGLFLLLVPPGLAERDELPVLGGLSSPGDSTACVMLYHG